MTEDSPSTRDRLLAAAERLFLLKGAEQVSVRAINAEAGLNPGAVHYHFGSREGLIAALLERELLPLWADRLEEIARRSRSGGAELDVAELVAAIVEPFDRLARTEKGRMLCHLLARTALPAGGVPNAVSAWFGAAPFEAMLARALPYLPVREVATRWRLAFTLLLEVYGRALAPNPTAPSPLPDPATVAAFITAGLTAPSPHRA
ncbi:TetR/AcrR family transcriptional regulator [Bailinhaonella thermotolerans]|uniref:TetR/AcrR family transcriptional regulator n=1 Tax=Bailinhaonella thermotolerans TaxID=1070861 RepID=A0A3A4B9J6_9ACTN|nr:TetR/AcrR family transcriptional regulator [Bailinhaonella thermotolerans]RJL35559.1 TetR/AcrR family transcriptional regulator [Bailinhaonella thermotolerans]